MSRMEVGDNIRCFTHTMGHITGTTDLVVEEFRDCIGVFETEQHRTMGLFKPLCDLYVRGPETEDKYMPNMGEYETNLVPGWMDLPKD